MTFTPFFLSKSACSGAGKSKEYNLATSRGSINNPVTTLRIGLPSLHLKCKCLPLHRLKPALWDLNLKLLFSVLLLTLYGNLKKAWFC